MNFDINTIIAIVGLILGLATTAIGFASAYSNQKIKAYGLERDYAHLKRNYETMSQEMVNLHRDINDKLDRFFLELVELKNRD